MISCRVADWQSAGHADCQSAIQQTSNPRYGEIVAAHMEFHSEGYVGPRIPIRNHTDSFRVTRRMHSMAVVGYPSAVSQRHEIGAAGMKIMIVDDHQEMRRLLRSTLDHLATEIREYADGSQAVAAFASERPDWTVMDVAMKGVDGLEATRRIKASFPDARILVLTQHDTPAVRRAARDAGASAFLSKDQLIEIERVLTAPGMILPEPGASTGPNPG